MFVACYNLLITAFSILENSSVQNLQSNTPTNSLPAPVLDLLLSPSLIRLTPSAPGSPFKLPVNTNTREFSIRRRVYWRKKAAWKGCTEGLCRRWWEWCRTRDFRFTASRYLSMLAWNTRQISRATNSKETQVGSGSFGIDSLMTHRKISLLGGLVLGVPAKLLCGGLAGALAQSFSYPFDVTRRRMQLAMMNPETAKFG